MVKAHEALLNTFEKGKRLRLFEKGKRTKRRSLVPLWVWGKDNQKPKKKKEKKLNLKKYKA